MREKKWKKLTLILLNKRKKEEKKQNTQLKMIRTEHNSVGMRNTLHHPSLFMVKTFFSVDSLTYLYLNVSKLSWSPRNPFEYYIIRMFRYFHLMNGSSNSKWFAKLQIQNCTFSLKHQFSLYHPVRKLHTTRKKQKQIHKNYF